MLSRTVSFTFLMLAASASASACGSGTPPPAKPAPAPAPLARPSIGECKALFEHLIEIALVEFDDDEEFREEIMATVRLQAPGPLEVRCRDEAAAQQIACLLASEDVGAVRSCAEPIYQCTKSEPRDETACAEMDRDWGWAGELIGAVFEI